MERGFHTDVDALICAHAYVFMRVSVYLFYCVYVYLWVASVIYEEADLWVR